MILSMIASATIWSAMASYHALTGICDAMMVDFFPCLSSIISMSRFLAVVSKSCSPKSSRMSSSVHSIFLSSCKMLPLAFATFNCTISLAVFAYSTLCPFWHALYSSAVAM